MIRVYWKLLHLSVLRVRGSQRVMKNYILGFLFISAAVSFANCTTPVTDSLKNGLSASRENQEDTVAGSNVEDFFLPKTPNNKVIFSTPGSSMTMSRHYSLQDSLVIIRDSTFVQGNYQSGEIKTVQFINNEAHLIRSESFFGTRSPKILEYNPSQIILKLPACSRIPGNCNGGRNSTKNRKVSIIHLSITSDHLCSLKKTINSLFSGTIRNYQSPQYLRQTGLNQTEQSTLSLRHLMRKQNTLPSFI